MTESRLTLVVSLGLLSVFLVSCFKEKGPVGISVIPYDGPEWCITNVETKPTEPKYTTKFTLKSKAEPGEPLILFTDSELVDEVFLQIPMCEITNLD